MQRTIFVALILLVCAALCYAIAVYVIQPALALHTMKQNNIALAHQRDMLRQDVEAKRVRIDKMNSAAGAESEARRIGMTKPNEVRVQLQLTQPEAPAGPSAAELAAQRDSRIITGAFIGLGALFIVAYILFHALASRRRRRALIIKTAAPGHG
ncbi:MAG: DUF6550 family protein [bacterium]